jgi:hypothetical protein
MDNLLVLPKEMKETEGPLPKSIVDAIIGVGLKAWDEHNCDTEFRVLGLSFSVSRPEPSKCVIRLLVKD